MTSFITPAGRAIFGVDLADTLHTQFMDGRSFDGVITPGTWNHMNLREAVLPTLQRLVEMYHATEDRDAKVAGFFDIDLGMIFVSLFHDVQEEQHAPVSHYLITNRRPEHFGMPHPYRQGEDSILDRAAAAIGAWLKSNLPTVSQGNTNPESETTMTVTTDHLSLIFPAGAPDFAWRRSLEAWVNDGVNDIKHDVDHQAAYLSDWAWEANFAWPLRASNTDFPEWATTATAKTFLSDAMLTKATRLFPVGCSILVADNDDTQMPTIASISAERLTGRTVKVTEVFRNTYDQGAARVVTDQGLFVRPWHATNVTDVQVELTPEQATIARLEDEMRRTREQASEYRRQHEADIETIGEALLNEAKNRDWCSEYDTVVSRLNRDLFIELAEREREVEVTINYTVSDSGTYSTTVRVSGDQDPEDVAREEFEEAYSHQEAWDNGDGNTNVEIDSIDSE